MSPPSEYRQVNACDFRALYPNQEFTFEEPVRITGNMAADGDLLVNIKAPAIILDIPATGPYCPFVKLEATEGDVEILGATDRVPVSVQAQGNIHARSIAAVSSLIARKTIEIEKLGDKSAAQSTFGSIGIGEVGSECKVTATAARAIVEAQSMGAGSLLSANLGSVIFHGTLKDNSTLQGSNVHCHDAIGSGWKIRASNRVELHNTASKNPNGNCEIRANNVYVNRLGPGVSVDSHFFAAKEVGYLGWTHAHGDMKPIRCSGDAGISFFINGVAHVKGNLCLNRYLDGIQIRDYSEDPSVKPPLKTSNCYIWPQTQDLANWWQSLGNPAPASLVGAPAR